MYCIQKKKICKNGIKDLNYVPIMTKGYKVELTWTYLFALKLNSGYILINPCSGAASTLNGLNALCLGGADEKNVLHSGTRPLLARRLVKWYSFDLHK